MITLTSSASRAWGRCGTLLRAVQAAALRRTNRLDLQRVDDLRTQIAALRAEEKNAILAAVKSTRRLCAFEATRQQ